MTSRNHPLLAAMLTALLFTCEKIPDFCGTNALYDPSCQFCFGSEAYNKCGGSEYNPLTQGCDRDRNAVGTRCLDESVVPIGTPCGGYTLTTAAAPEFGGSVQYSAPNAGPPYAFGTQIVLSAIAKADYTFAGWAGTQPAGGGEVATYTANGSSPRVTIVAMFKPKAAGRLITEAFPKNTGTVTRNPDKEIYGDGETVTVRAEAAAGYAFDGWSGADGTKNNPATITMNDSKTLVAIFTPTVRTLSVSAFPPDAGAVFVNGTALTGAASQSFGTRAAVWAVPERGYTFQKWSGTAAEFDDEGNANTTVTIGSNATVTAHFQRGGDGTATPPPAMIYTLTVSPNIGGSVSLSPDGGVYSIGTQVTATAAASDGYEFKNWTGASTSASRVETIIMDGDKTLAAVFQLRQAQQTFVATITSIGTGAAGGGSYAAGAPVSISAGTAPEGYSFKNWTSAPSVTFADANSAMTTFAMPTNAVTVTANFEQQSGGTPSAPLYTVTVSSAGSDATGGKGYKEDDQVNIYAGTPPDGYSFKNWTTASGVTINNADKLSASFTMPAHAVTVTANFEAITYGVTVTSIGTGATGGGSYAAGQTVPINAGTPPTGQRFKNWTSADGVIFTHAANAATAFTMPAKAVTVTAVFEPVYTVTVDGGGTGATGGEKSYAAGETVSISAGQTPSGKQFKNWTSNPTSVTFANATSATTTFTMPTSAVTVTANWETESSGGGNNVVGNNNCTSAEKCKSKEMPDGKVWMTENLNIATANSWCYDNKQDSCAKYGRLYTWAAAKTVCPMGWHLPSRSEWQSLVDSAGGYSTAGKKLKSTSGWNGYKGQSGNGTDDYGFSALPGGLQYSDGSFGGDAGYYGGWWTATEDDGSNAYSRIMNYDNDNVFEYNIDKGYGFSVRCVAGDAPVTPTPTTYTVTVSSTGSGATGGGSYTAGASVSISAGTAPSGQTFKNWTAMGVTLSNPNSAATTFTMPANAVTVTANFEAATPTDTIEYVTIGGKKWMSKNMNLLTANPSWCYGEGGQASDYVSWTYKTLSSSEILANCNKYGRLYTWAAAQTVCPSGWHLPSRAEWGALAKATGGTGDYGQNGTAGKALKSTGGWYNSGNGTDTYGFSALPGGIRSIDGTFYNADIVGFWWTATEVGSGNAYIRGMGYDADYVNEGDAVKGSGHSVRCVAD